MSNRIAVDQLRVGMFVHLDLGWWQHPFALSSFRIATSDQIDTIRGLGLTDVRWSPEKSSTAVGGLLADDAVAASDDANVAVAAPTEAAAPAAPVTESPEEAARRRLRERLAAQRAAVRRCERQYAEAAQALRQANDLSLAQPQRARETAEGLAGALLDKMAIDSELSIRTLNEAQGDRATQHGLNVAVIAMLMGRVFGLTRAEMMDLGTGALIHDIGKNDLPDRVRHPDNEASSAELALYREHVARGVDLGRRMGLSAGALLVVAQHHEMADGSGFPQRLNIDRMTAAARIVALVNRFDNLCNPPQPARALTPHEALSVMFAQSQSKFDVSMLNAFIRMMGVYPPGSAVQLTDDRYALVVSVNSNRPLKPRVLVHDPAVPAAEALTLSLEDVPDLGIRRSLRPQQLPSDVAAYLSPRVRMVYFFEPEMSVADDAAAGGAADTASPRALAA